MGQPANKLAAVLCDIPSLDINGSNLSWNVGVVFEGEVPLGQSDPLFRAVVIKLFTSCLKFENFCITLELVIHRNGLAELLIPCSFC